VPGYLLNGVAAALPATLVIFFIDDVLKLSAHSGLFLVIYFSAARSACRCGCAGQTHRHAGCLAGVDGPVDRRFHRRVLAGRGRPGGYALVCAASGLALGADLALPPALVADIIDRDPAPQPGAYYGLMSFFAKLTLALAAGLALPLLDFWGYQPGGDQLLALSATYALLPIA
jgi:glycoside/pentoside/hexuronide:cation symporter, GPH family